MQCVVCKAELEETDAMMVRCTECHAYNYKAKPMGKPEGWIRHLLRLWKK